MGFLEAWPVALGNVAMNLRGAPEGPSETGFTGVGRLFGIFLRAPDFAACTHVNRQPQTTAAGLGAKRHYAIGFKRRFVKEFAILAGLAGNRLIKSAFATQNVAADLGVTVSRFPFLRKGGRICASCGVLSPNAECRQMDRGWNSRNQGVAPSGMLCPGSQIAREDAGCGPY